MCGVFFAGWPHPFNSSRSSRQAATLTGRLLYLIGGIAGIIELI
jgi:hypothetical protein